MGQRPIAVRVKTDIGAQRAGNLKQGAGSQSQGVTLEAEMPEALEGPVYSVSGAARCLGVSERTIFRLLKAGELERVEAPATVAHEENVVFVSDKNVSGNHRLLVDGRVVSLSMTDKNNDMTDISVIVKIFDEQIKEKDQQIALLIHEKLEMGQTMKRLQEQLFELAHLVLTHNVAAAQARTENEVKVQEQASRSGLAGLLGARKR